MSIGRWVNGSNDREDDLKEILEYAEDPMKTQGYIYAHGCDEDAILEDMRLVKKSRRKEKGKQYEHFVLSITPDLKYNTNEMYMEIARRIVGYFDGHQSAAMLHLDTETRHLHIIINSVNYKTGKKFSQGPPGLKSFKSYCNHILGSFDLDLIKVNPERMLDTDMHSFKSGFDFLEIHNDVPDKRISVLVDDLLKDDSRSESPKYPYIEYPMYHRRYGNNLNYYGGNKMNNSNVFPNNYSQYRPYQQSEQQFPAPENVTQLPSKIATRQQTGMLSVGTFNHIKIETHSVNESAALAKEISNGVDMSAERLAEYASIGVQTKAELEKRNSSCNVHVGVYNDVHITVASYKEDKMHDIIEADFSDIS